MIPNKIFEEIKKILVTEFEIDENIITMEANLKEDLALDSIDTIDLFVKMKDFIPSGKGNTDPSILRTVHTVKDFVDVLLPYLSDETLTAPETKNLSDKAEN